MKLAQYALAVVLLLAGAAAAQAPVARSTGQMLYLPIYSHVWHGDLDSRGDLRYLHRRANIEDVFLNLTGRDLRD